MPQSSPADLVRRSFQYSLAWGLAVATVHLAIGVGLLIALNVPPMTWFAAKSVLMETALALPIGLLLTPVLALPGGRWLHPIALAAVWIGLERWVAVDPGKLQMWIAPSIVALLLLGAATTLWRRWPRAVLAVALVLPVLLVSAPVVNYRLGGYEVAPNANRGTPPADAPDVLFIVMDTVRAKSVSAYGYERATTPNFDAFAKEGALYTDANSAATWSLPAHASLFTGHYPSTHEAHDETRFLDDRLPTLASTLSEAGWETLAFTANPYIADTYGLTRGFDWTDKAWMTGEGGRQFSFIYRLIDKLGFAAEDKGGHQVVANIRQWLRARKKDAPPAFVFVNFLEAHFPFDQLPERHLRAWAKDDRRALSAASQTAFGVQFGRQLTPAEEGQIRQPLIDMYDGGVRYTDELVGEVIELWRERGTLDDTVVVVLADHGEMMGEHGAFGHVTSLYQPDLHVPLAFRYPKRIPAGTVVSEPVSTVGVFASLMDLLGTAPKAPLDAGSLVPGSGTRTAQIAERYEGAMLASRFAPGTANGKGPLLQPWGRYRTYREGSWKLGQHSKCDTPEAPVSTFLFDLASDPDEQHDLAASNAEKRAEIEAVLGGHMARIPLPPLCAAVGTKAPELTLSCEECCNLLKLGYMDKCDGCSCE